MLKLVRFPNRSPNWYVRGTVKGGERILESTGTTDRTHAEEFRNRLEREQFDRYRLGYRKPASFADVAVSYVEAGGEKRFALKLMDYFKDTPISEIGQDEINKAARALYPKGKASTMVRQVYGPMISILNYALEARFNGAAPIKIKCPKVDRPPAKWANDEHVFKLLAHCNPQLRAIVLVMTYTGLRVSECLRMEPKDFRMREGFVHVGKTKNGEPAMVPLPAVALEAVEAVLPATGPAFGYTTQQGVNSALRRAAEAAGLPYLSSHKIGRHTFAARLLTGGYDIKTVKEAGRWKTLRIVDQTYGHLEESHVHDAMLKVAAGVKLVADETEGANE